MEWILALFAIWVLSNLSGSSSRTRKDRDSDKEPHPDQALRRQSDETRRRIKAELMELQKLQRREISSTKRLSSKPTESIKEYDPKIITTGSTTSPPKSEAPQAQHRVRSTASQSRRSAFSTKSVSSEFSEIELEGLTSQSEKCAAALQFETFGVRCFWHITHLKNLSSVLEKGILSNSEAFLRAYPVDISNHDVQRWRTKKDPFYGRMLHDYVPLYINAKNPMLYVKGTFRMKYAY